MAGSLRYIRRGEVAALAGPATFARCHAMVRRCHRNHADMPYVR